MKKIVFVFLVLSLADDCFSFNGNKVVPNNATEALKSGSSKQRIQLWRSHPESPVLAYNAVEAYLALNQRDKAEKLYRESVKKFPSSSFFNKFAKAFPNAPKGTPKWHIQLHRSYPENPVLAHNAVEAYLALDQWDKAEKLYRESVQKFPSSRVFNKFAKVFPDEAPEVRISLILNQKLQNYLANAGEEIRFTAKEPIKREAPPLPTLVKGEFEKTVAFKARVAQEQRKRKNLIAGIEEDYRQDLLAYNEEVETYNLRLKEAVNERNRNLPVKRREFLARAIAEVYGNPILKRLDYDADREVFNARVESTRKNFTQDLEISVPINDAPAFKKSQINTSPAVLMSLKGNRLVIDKLEVDDGKQYAATFASGEIASPVRVTLEETRINVSGIDKLAINERSASLDESQYFNDAIQLEDNPELAEIKQREAELARKKREVLLAKRQEEELVKRKEQLALAELELARLKGDDSYLGLTAKTRWSFQPAERKKPNMIAVIVGNRRYEKGIPQVHYALNDARAMKKMLVERLGVDESNILYRENATKGHMEALFESELPNRVAAAGENPEVFVYFSGHGFPDKKNAVLLPSDALPGSATVSGYSRDRLLSKLGELHAQVALVLDACFTGTSKSDAVILKNAKAQFRAPNKAEVPNNLILIGSSKADQVSWGDDEIGHSVMTYFLLKGLSGEADQNNDGDIRPRELQEFLRKNVNDFARKKHSRPQEPEIVVGRKSLNYAF